MRGYLTYKRWENPTMSEPKSSVISTNDRDVTRARLRITKTMDTSFSLGSGQKIYKLSEVTHPDVAARYWKSAPCYY
ncbi:hypothetical protein MFAL_18370 [Mycolicibacterium fallax]|nr:hypothetical protein MFAL_18370 [Mycolicibacterium fallax]